MQCHQYFHPPVLSAPRRLRETTMSLLPEEQRILEALSNGPKSFDELREASQLRTTLLKKSLGLLTAKGFVQRSFFGKRSLTEAGKRALPGK